MLTVTLRSDADSLLLCTVEGPEQVAYNTIADMAGRPPADTTAELRDRLAGALTAAALNVNTYNGFDTGAGSTTFDRLTVGDGDVLTDYPLWTFTHDGAIKAWQTRDRGRGGEKRDPEEGFIEGPGRGPRTHAQAMADRKRVADLLAEHPKPDEARAAILSDLDDEGDASTVAEFDRINGDQWTPERQALHNQIIDDWLAKAGHIPRDHQAIVLGGLPGSGKSNVLKNAKVGVDASKYLTLDPDGIKQELLDRGAIERVPGMTDGEYAAWLHAESSAIVDQLRARAVKRGMNIIIDKTMSKSPSKDLGKLAKQGYLVHGIFVDIGIDESKESVLGRWKEGGRFVPGKYIEGSRVEGANSKNALAFQSAADLFDHWTYVTNYGIAKRDPDTQVRHGSGRFEFASQNMMVFRSLEDVPRDYHGRWTGIGGQDAAKATAGADTVTDDQRVHVSPADAVELIKNLGNRPDPADLTKVSIDGHPGLFGAVARNTMRRVDMPQIPSDKLDAFASYLQARGIKIHDEFVSPLELKATQNELDGRKVGQMITAMQQGTMPPHDKPLWASSDGYILDGHHRWAAEAVLAAAGSDRPPMLVVRAETPMTQLIGQARAFNQLEGIDSKSHGMTLVRVGQFTHEGALKAWETRKRNAEAGAAPEPPADAVADHHSDGVGNGLPTADEFDAMEKTGGPLGSQGGGWYRDSNGQRYLVKPAQSRSHAMNELAMSLLYQHDGIPSDQTGIFERDGKWFIAKKAIQSPDGKLGKIVGDDITPALQAQAREGFGTDALASSWDAYGLVGDNVLTRDGTLYRIDVGGSGMYRAQGGDKPSFNPGKEWVEPSTLRTSNQGRKLYGKMTDQEAADSLAALHGFDVDAFDRKLGRVGIDSNVRTRVVATVRDRIDNQLDPIIAALDPQHLVASATFTHEGAVKAWQTRPRAKPDDVTTMDAARFGKLVPSKRTTTPKEWLASKSEIAACRKLAASKARNVPQPTEAEIAKNVAVLEKAKTHGRAGGELRGNSQTRRERGEALFAEFGGTEKGYCPCNYCGIKVSPKGRGGHAAMQQDKILTASEGGRYGTKNSFPNLVPACAGCNASRNDEPYHIRPKWEKKGALAAAADMPVAALADEPVGDGETVVAFPLGWNDPNIDTIGTPVEGILARRTAQTPWGSYEQTLVGGEVVDPDTISPVAATAEFTHEGAVKAWESRDRGGGGGSGGFGSAGEARSAFEDAVTSTPFDEKAFNDRYDAFDAKYREKLKAGRGPIDDFVGDYTDWAYEEVNQALKKGGEPEQWIAESVAGLDKDIADFGTASPPGLMRGKGKGSRLAELNWEVGHTFTDPAYGSWSSDPKVALKFAKDDGKGSVVMRLKNSKSVQSIPGKQAEAESILPRGVKYKVVGVSDFTGPDGVKHRIMDVEAQ